MGNSAAKYLQERPLSSGFLIGNDRACIDPKYVTSHTLRLTGSTGSRRSKYCNTDTGELIFSSTYQKGQGTMMDAGGHVLAAFKIIKGVLHDSMMIYRSKPSFKGQAHSTDITATSASGQPLIMYEFATCETYRGFMKGESTYSLIQDGLKRIPLYVGEKIKSLTYLVVIERPDGEAVAKAAHGKWSLKGPSFMFEVAPGVDVVAAIAVAVSLDDSSGGGSSAGALAGAGVT